MLLPHQELLQASHSPTKDNVINDEIPMKIALVGILLVEIHQDLKIWRKKGNNIGGK